MKKHLFVLLTLFSVCLIGLRGQELVPGGDMEEESGWTVFFSEGTGTNDPVATFGSTTDCPSSGEGGCLTVEWFAPLRVQIYQPVTLQKGHIYKLTGDFRNTSSVLCNSNWLELILAKTEPNVEGDWGAGAGDYRYQMHSWKGDPYQNIDEADGTFQGLLPLEWLGAASGGGDSLLSSPLLDDMPPGGDTLLFTLADTVSTENWYVVIKFGRTTTGDTGAEEGAFTFHFDNISLLDVTGGTPSGLPGINTRNIFSVFPSPSYGMVIIQGELTNIPYEIINNLGVTVSSGILLQSILDLSHLESGVYFIRLNTGSNKEVHKIILQ